MRDIEALSAPIQENERESILDSHKLSEQDYEAIVRILGRVPNLIEIGIFSAMWSEHCS